MERKVKIAVAGCGGFGGEHLRALSLNSRAEVTAACDIREDRLKEKTELYNVPAAFSDYNEMLKNADIDAVIVAAYDQAHKDITVAALRAGKHVLCEKPMALTEEDCAEMVKAEEETGKKLMIGQVCRMTPGFVMAKRLVDEGVIGELFYVESEYAHDYSSFTKATSWRADPLRHIVIGGACHAIDLLRWIAGNPYETTCYSNKKMLTYLPTDDCAIAIFRFPNDVIGKVFTSSGCKRSYTMRTALYGSRGTIIVNNTDPYLTVYRERIVQGEKILEGALGRERESGIEVRCPVELANHNLQGEHKEFLDAILNDTPVKTNGREGMMTVQVCRAVIKSADEHKTVQITY